jgi:hypothetical protein
MKRDTLIAHKETTIMCEENRPKGYNYYFNQLITTIILEEKPKLVG